MCSGYIFMLRMFEVSIIIFKQFKYYSYSQYFICVWGNNIEARNIWDSLLGIKPVICARTWLFSYFIEIFLYGKTIYAMRCFCILYIWCVRNKDRFEIWNIRIMKKVCTLTQNWFNKKAFYIRLGPKSILINNSETILDRNT